MSHFFIPGGEETTIIQPGRYKTESKITLLHWEKETSSLVSGEITQKTGRQQKKKTDPQATGK